MISNQTPLVAEVKNGLEMFFKVAKEAKEPKTLLTCYVKMVNIEKDNNLDKMQLQSILESCQNSP